MLFGDWQRPLSREGHNSDRTSGDTFPGFWILTMFTTIHRKNKSHVLGNATPV